MFKKIMFYSATAVGMVQYTNMMQDAPIPSTAESRRPSVASNTTTAPFW